MDLNERQKKEFDQKTKEVIKWLNDNCHPMCEVTITTTYAELFEGQYVINTKEFLRH